MRRLFLYALASLSVLLWSVPASSSDKSSRPEIERVVRAFGAVEMFQARLASYLKVAGEPRDDDARKTRLFAERVVAANPADLSPAFVQMFAPLLSTAEAVEMAEALETPIGRKIIRMSIEAHRVYGGDIVATRDANPLSSEERSQLQELGSMPGWRVYRRVSSDTASIRRMSQEMLALPMFADLR